MNEANKIDVALAIRKAERSENSRDELIALGSALFARQCIHHEASRLAERPGFVDPLEVYLRLEIALQEAFNLPGSTQSMLFQSCANVSHDDIEQVRRYTNEQLRSEALNAFISNWDPMIHLNRQELVAAFDIKNLNVISADSAGITSISTCGITFEQFQSLIDEGKEVVALMHNSQSYTIYEKESLLKSWVESGRAFNENKAINFEEYCSRMYRISE